MVKGQSLANFCCPEPESESFQLRRLWGQCCNYLTLPLTLKASLDNVGTNGGVVFL